MGYPQSGYPPVQPGGGSRRPAVIAVAVAGALVVAAVAGGFVLLNQDDEGSDRADPAVSASASVPGPGTGGGTETPEAPPTPQAPEAPGGPAVDANFGISVPVPDGWQKQDTGAEGNAYISTDPYECAESSTGSCVAAGVYTGPGSGSDPKAAAQKDIEANAKDSYGEVKSHQEAKAGKVTVAGKPGYLIRWKLDVAEGTDGYVQSVAFKSPVNGRMTVVRFGFDDKDGAPELSVMDEILKGIRAVGSPNGV